LLAPLVLLRFLWLPPVQLSCPPLTTHTSPPTTYGVTVSSLFLYCIPPCMAACRPSGNLGASATSADHGWLSSDRQLEATLRSPAASHPRYQSHPSNPWSEFLTTIQLIARIRRLVLVRRSLCHRLHSAWPPSLFAPIVGALRTSLCTGTATGADVSEAVFV